MTSSEGTPAKALFVGPTSTFPLAADVLGLSPDRRDPVPLGSVPLGESSDALVTEFPVPGALRLVGTLRAIVPLCGTIEETIAGYDAELRRKLRKLTAEYRFRPITAAAEIERVRTEMLVAYGEARHGWRAVHPSFEEVARAARGGCLHLLLHGDEPVGAHLGMAYEREGRRYFATIRFGYPAAVFQDARRLRDANAMSAHLALRHALDAGFQFYDIGTSVARPDGGLLQFKRRRGGALDPWGCSWMWLRLPRPGASQLLWDSPVFTLERGGLALNVGIPPGKTLEEAAKRIHELGYAGLRTVRVHGAPADGDIAGAVSALYARHGAAPALEIVEAS